MRTKEKIMKQVKDSSMDLRDDLYLEVLTDIRDQLALLNQKIPVVRKAGQPVSAPPPEVSS